MSIPLADSLAGGATGIEVAQYSHDTADCRIGGSRFDGLLATEHYLKNPMAVRASAVLTGRDTPATRSLSLFRRSLAIFFALAYQ
jgi:hypothetical protein